MLKRPSEMEDVPQKITLRDKLTLSSQILLKPCSLLPSDIPFLFPSEQACVICGTKGQEGKVVNFGNIDNRDETFIFTE